MKTFDNIDLFNDDCGYDEWLTIQAGNPEYVPIEPSEEEFEWLIDQALASL